MSPLPLSDSPAQLLREGQERGLPAWECRRLLEHTSGRTRAWLVAHDQEPLPAEQAGRTRQALARLQAGEPLAYVVGEQEFHGLTLQVSPAVLVPRPDTETLVDWALALLPADAEGSALPVLDLGTGSGAVALALKASRPQRQVCASDLSPAALAVAQGNGQRLGLTVDWRQGAWWQPWHGERFELVVSNPPYIAADDPHLAALHHEPRLALTPEGDGLDGVRALAAGAVSHLTPGGWLLLEHGWDQHEAVAALLVAHGLEEVQSRQDLGGRWRCTGGRRPARA
nr:peptide chain release factor N(5)-glutamine methyltransferase [Ideonella livida]